MKQLTIIEKNQRVRLRKNIAQEAEDPTPYTPGQKIYWHHSGRARLSTPGAWQLIILVAVDIGLRDLFRRLGMEFMVKNRENHFVGWQYITPLEKKANLQLSHLHPADVADIIEVLDHLARTELINQLDAQTAAEALAEVDLETQVKIMAIKEKADG